jgi:hypothetical protein
MKKTMTLTLAASILSLTLSAFPYPAAASITTTPTPPNQPSLRFPIIIHRVTGESDGMSIAEMVVDLAKSALTFLGH